MWDEVHVQLHDVTGKVQRARLIIAAQVREACMATPTATMERKMPGSGGSCYWDRAGSTR